MGTSGVPEFMGSFVAKKRVCVFEAVDAAETHVLGLNDCLRCDFQQQIMKDILEFLPKRKQPINICVV